MRENERENGEVDLSCCGYSLNSDSCLDIMIAFGGSRSRHPY